MMSNTDCLMREEIGRTGRDFGTDRRRRPRAEPAIIRIRLRINLSYNDRAMEVEILIVDNDPVVCYLSQELLQDIGFTTLILQDSRRVLQTVKELKPRAVLLDILMPGIDGLTLCRSIKADPETKQ